ncbi:MAG: phosphoenolpyruvate--protein phosphotransferase [Candidatus Muiribacterium halophilum]|uniref:Phosphoenolpyruvate-protein phosphotransferase n=1 Tax=Muiribacterium halophilum TaxID=2053465 RepID=A0A2N5ZI58_MUIH1|nr:MAG: phosphoenolpyruvate--protein phosphotransferase [Candidatus Muirbacterium halophilum]
MIFKGIKVSEGVAVGKCRVIRDTFSLEMYAIDNVEHELERFKKATLEVKNDIFETIDKFENGKGVEGIDIQVFKAHAQIIEDPMLYSEIYSRIKEQKKNADWIIKEVVEDIVAKFEKSENELLKDRAIDIKDVGYRLISNLNNIGLDELKNVSGFIIVAEELTPTQLLHLAEEGVAGIVTEKGGITSHVAIFSRSLEIPAMTGIKRIIDYLSDGDIVVIDSEKSEVLFNLTDKELRRYLFLKRQYDKIRKKKKSTRTMKSITRDGVEISIGANIQLSTEINKMKEYGIKNIGLFRTEFLFMDRDNIPDEDEQYEYYKKMAQTFDGESIVIRTLDAGGDKNVKGINDIRSENNPFLGWRGIRICLDRPEILKTQMKAILRAAKHTKIKILYPMVSTPIQMDKILELFDEARAELIESKVEFSDNVEHGVLLEVPSAVLYMDYFAEKVQFFSIGTNDLLQFLLAVDRMNSRIANLFSWYNRALYMVLKEIVEKAKRYSLPVQVCGELAADPRSLPVLIGLGITELSMTSSSVPKIKLLIRSVSVDECKEVAEKVLSYFKYEEIKDFLSEKFKEFMGREEFLNEMSEMWEGK